MKSSDFIKYTLAAAVVVVVGVLAWRLSMPKAEIGTPSAQAPVTTGVAQPNQQQQAMAGANPASASVQGEEETVNENALPAQAQDASGQNSQVIINGRPLPLDQLRLLQAQYRAQVPPGKYWYDSRSGFWGLEGYAVAGYIQPGLNLGRLSPDASNGNTGVFVNGRELNQAEAMFFAKIFGSYQQGRFWLDGNTGSVGYEGDPTPRDNLFARIRQSQSGGSQAFSRGSMVGVTNGSCTMVTTDTGYNASTPGCD